MMDQGTTSKEENPDTSSRETTLLTAHWDEAAVDEKKEQSEQWKAVSVEGAVGANIDDGGDEDKGGGNNKESPEAQDEYGYTKRDPSSSELYKVCIKNIRSRFGFRVRFFMK